MCRYGGILLHADRFKHINNVARTLIQDTGLGLEVVIQTQDIQYTQTDSCNSHSTRHQLKATPKTRNTVSLPTSQRGENTDSKHLS